VASPTRASWGSWVAGSSSIVVEDQAELVEQRDERADQTAE
jgi:hypothetical protein